MDTQDFWDLCRAFFAVALVLTGLTAVWRLRNWNVRTSRYEAQATIAVSPPRLRAPELPLDGGRSPRTKSSLWIAAIDGAGWLGRFAPRSDTRACRG